VAKFVFEVFRCLFNSHSAYVSASFVKHSFFRTEEALNRASSVVLFAILLFELFVFYLVLEVSIATHF
jgi:hypothetical protein